MIKDLPVNNGKIEILGKIYAVTKTGVNYLNLIGPSGSKYILSTAPKLDDKLYFLMQAGLGKLICEFKYVNGVSISV
jgi:hypothetical protein